MIKEVCLLMSPSESSLKYPNELTRLPLNLGLGVICAYLEQLNYNVAIRDLNITLAREFQSKGDRKRLEQVFDLSIFRDYLSGKTDERMDQLLHDFLKDIEMSRFDIFGVSIGADFSFVQIQLGFLIAKYIQKTYHKEVFIGGNNISFLYIFKDIFKEMWEIVLAAFRFVINGPGEKVIESIIKGLDENKEEIYFGSLPGILRIKDGVIISNQTEKPIVIKPDWGDCDLTCYTRCMVEEGNTQKQKEKALKENLLYFYKWADTYLDSPGLIVNQYNRRKRKDTEEKLILPYIFNYNCPYNCAFCTQSDYERGDIIGADAAKVIEDIKQLMEKYNTKYFYFLNNAFNYSNKFVTEFCNQIIDQKIEIYWSDCGRFNNLTYEKLELMKKAGCVKLTFGFESGSKKIIELIDKKIDLDHAETVLKWCHDLNIWADLEVIIGLPQETNDDFEDTCNFIRKNSKYINFFWVNEFFVVPNSLIGRNPEKYGIKLIKDMNSYKELLEDNLKLYREEPTDVMTRNSKLYGYHEIDGKTFAEIVKQNSKKIGVINHLQNKEGDSAAKFYKMLSTV